MGERVGMMDYRQYTLPLFDNVERKCERATNEVRSCVPKCLLEEQVSPDSRYYVYGFYNCAWNEFFYIGKGTGNRINDNKRNAQVKAVLNAYECIRVVFVDGLTNNAALTVEKAIKRHLKTQGKPIIDYECIGYSENQKVGIEKARAQGKYKGRKPVVIDDKIFKTQYDRYKRRDITKGELAKILKISRPTLDKVLNLRTK